MPNMEEIQIVVRKVPAPLWKQFKIQAAVEGKTIQDLFSIALRQYLDKAA